MQDSSVLSFSHCHYILLELSDLNILEAFTRHPHCVGDEREKSLSKDKP